MNWLPPSHDDLPLLGFASSGSIQALVRSFRIKRFGTSLFSLGLDWICFRADLTRTEGREDGSAKVEMARTIEATYCIRNTNTDLLILMIK